MLFNGKFAACIKSIRFMANVINTIKSRYIKLMGKEPPFFTDSNYTIEQFAADLGTNRSYASKFVNEELGVNFYTLLSRLRLAHFMKLHGNGEKCSISSLAKRSGFNNVFSFRRAFRREYGTTPSEYLKQTTGHNTNCNNHL